MKIRLVQDIDRKTTIPKSEMRKAVEKVYGVKLDPPKKKAKKTNVTVTSSQFHYNLI